MTYATYSQYTALGYNAVTETEFNGLAARASQKLDILTGHRAASATGYKQEALVAACCALVDVFHGNDQSVAGKGITSVSNDGYTETYAVQTSEQLESSIRSEAFKWLSGTGLMGAWAV